MSEMHHPNYVRIWVVLMVLLAISIVGPLLGVRILTLITAFGIAIVKAYLVARNFMHLNVQPRYAIYLLSTVLVFMFLLFSGASPDVMRHEGQGWVKLPRAEAEVAVEPAHH